MKNINEFHTRFNASFCVEYDEKSYPNGIYFLHIYDGMGNKPEMQIIVVQH